MKGYIMLCNITLILLDGKAVEPESFLTIALLFINQTVSALLQSNVSYRDEEGEIQQLAARHLANTFIQSNLENTND